MLMYEHLDVSRISDVLTMTSIERSRSYMVIRPAMLSFIASTVL